MLEQAEAQLADFDGWYPLARAVREFRATIAERMSLPDGAAAVAKDGPIPEDLDLKNASLAVISWLASGRLDTRLKVRGRVVGPVDYLYWDTSAAGRSLITGVAGGGQNAGIVEVPLEEMAILVREHLDNPGQMREPTGGGEVQIGPPLSDFWDIRHPNDPIDLQKLLMEARKARTRELDQYLDQVKRGERNDPGAPKALLLEALRRIDRVNRQDSRATAAFDIEEKPAVRPQDTIHDQASAAVANGEASTPLARKRSRKGPVPGTVKRYGDAYIALFPELEDLMKGSKLSRTAATERLAEQGKIPGTGTSISRAKALARYYKKERLDK
jgi:hypothetical protein